MLLLSIVYFFVIITILNTKEQMNTSFLVASHLLSLLVILLLYVRMKRYERQAVTSNLCNLPNLRGLRLIISPLFARFSRRIVREIAVVVVDIDDFKKVNDVIGYRNADRVIGTLGNVLHERVRTTDVVAHIHGDEFVIVFTDAGQRVVLEIMKRAQAVFRRKWYPFAVHKDGTRTIEITFSFGVAHSNQPGINFEELFDEAECALKSAKRNKQ